MNKTTDQIVKKVYNNYKWYTSKSKDMNEGERVVARLSNEALKEAIESSIRETKKQTLAEVRDSLLNIDDCIEVKRKDGSTTFAITFEKIKQKLGLSDEVKK